MLPGLWFPGSHPRDTMLEGGGREVPPSPTVSLRSGEQGEPVPNEGERCRLRFRLQASLTFLRLSAFPSPTPVASNTVVLK